MATKTTKTIREIINSSPNRNPFKSMLIEMEEMGLVAPDAEIEVEPEASPEEQIKAGIMAAVIKKLESDPEFLKAVVELADMGDPLEAPPEEDFEAAMLPDTATPTNGKANGKTKGEAVKEVVAESIESKRRIRFLESKNLILEAGRKATPELVEAIAAISPRAGARLLEQMPSGTRPFSSPPMYEDRHSTNNGRQSSIDRVKAKLKLARERLTNR